MNTTPPINPPATTSKRAYWLASVCALAWFALWLTAFRPAPTSLFQPESPPRLILHPDINGSFALQNPTRFARPSQEGFSGTFPPERIPLRLALRQPHPPETYLSRPSAIAPAQNQPESIEAIPLPQSELPAPGAARTTLVRHPGRIELFFSPELQSRADCAEPFKEIEALSLVTLRIHLTVRPDGTVAHALFETPAEPPALLSAIRKIRFSPSPETTVGWLDIRFTPPAGKRN